ncbi:MAG: glycoside hydrolase family 71/99 protein [Eubacteriales bacterium]
MEKSKPLIGAIRWDAWFPGNTPRGFVDPSLYTKYNYRMPFYGWFDTCVENEDEIMNKQIEYAAQSKLDFWAFVWYPEDSSSETSKKLSYGLRNYMTSSKHNMIKFCLILQTSWVAGAGKEKWRNVYVPFFIGKMLDTQYVFVNDGRPLVFWMDTSVLDSEETGFGCRWHEEIDYFKEQAIKSGLGEPFITDMRNDYESAYKYRFDAVSDYGPASIGHTGHQPYAALAKHDREKIKDYKGLKIIPGVSAVIDPRPRDQNEFIKYANFTYGHSFEMPTCGEWLEHLRSMVHWLDENKNMTCSPGVLVIYAWNELDEGNGGIVPTKQDGTMFLDGIKAVKTGIYTQTVLNKVNNSNPMIHYTGSWETAFPVYECRCNEMCFSNKLGDSFEFEFTGTSIYFTGEKGPGCGLIEVYMDNILTDRISLFYSERAFDIIYKSTELQNEKHTLKVIISEKGDVPMLGNYFALDTLFYTSDMNDIFYDGNKNCI